MVEPVLSVDLCNPQSPRAAGIAVIVRVVGD